MKRIARTIVVIATAGASLVMFNPAASAATTVVINGVSYQDLGVVPLGGLPSTTTILSPIDGLIDAINAAVKTCVPKSTSTTINDPVAHVYYGTLDSLYYWQDWAQASESGCPGNQVTMKAQLCDQSLDGTTLPTCGDQATYTGTASASGTAELFVDYPNITLLTGSPHAITMTVTATQTDGKTTTAWCSTRTWTYLATAAGPEFIGGTATNRCGS